MKVELKGNELVITIRTNDLKSLPASKSGKTKLVATTGGNVTTDLMIQGEALVIGLNAYIKA